MLEVDIQVRFPNFTLDAQFSAPGGITAIQGPSGSGKTTLINALAGLVVPNSGQISLGGQLMFCAETQVCVPTEKRQIGYIFQDARLFPHLTVAQNLSAGRWFRRLKSNAVLQQEVIEILGIEALLNRRPNKLSGGEKQRVAIGRALLTEPKLILADEPLSSLDSTRKEEIFPYFERLRDHAGPPIVYVSHHADEIERLADRTLSIENGALRD